MISSASLRPQEHIQVVLTVRTSGSDGSSSIVGLISVSESIIDRKVYVFTGRPVSWAVWREQARDELKFPSKLSFFTQRSDRTKPDIDYEYNGNCDDANTGNTCLRKRWSANVVARDKESGNYHYKNTEKKVAFKYYSLFIRITELLVRASRTDIHIRVHSRN